MVKLIIMFDPFDRSMKLISSTSEPEKVKISKMSRLEIITPRTPIADIATKSKKLAAHRHLAHLLMAFCEKQHIFKFNN